MINLRNNGKLRKVFIFTEEACYCMFEGPKFNTVWSVSFYDSGITLETIPFIGSYSSDGKEYQPYGIDYGRYPISSDGFICSAVKKVVEIVNTEHENGSQGKNQPIAKSRPRI